MEKRHENLYECTNYMVQLFYKTEKRYSCTRTKIGKLLSILAFKYAVKDILLFDEPIYRYPKCGTAINTIMFIVDRDVYFAYPYEDTKKRISSWDLNECVNIPERYKDVQLTHEVKRAIEDVFFNFGAYYQWELSEELNPIVEYEGICWSNGIINLEKIAKLDKNQFSNNKVVEYIFK